MNTVRSYLSFRVTVVASALWLTGKLMAVEAPVFSPAGQVSTLAVTVTVTCPTPDATIHYTLNGQEPTELDPVLASGSSLTVKRSLTLKAKAWLDGNSSEITEQSLTLTGNISLGAQHSLALRSNGTVFSWGNQAAGRLGNGFTTNGSITAPGAAKKSSTVAIADAVSISAGETHSAYVDSAGGVWGFGGNGNGQIGNNTLTTQAYPVGVLKSATVGDFLTGADQVAAGSNFTIARMLNGKVYSWGSGSSGALGDAATFLGNKKYATTVKFDSSGYPELTGVVAVRAGANHVLARTAHALEESGGTGTLYNWGSCQNGQLGYGSDGLSSSTWVAIAPGITDVWDMAAGETHSAVVRWKEGDPDLQGTVWCFGQRAKGRIGDNGAITGNATSPVKVVKVDGSPLEGVEQLAAGNNHVLALDRDGHVWAWGGNNYGGLGDGSTTDRKYAVVVKAPNGTDALSNIVKVVAGGTTGTVNGGFSAAIAKDGTVYMWGYNFYGQVANGSTGSAAVTLPTIIANFKTVPAAPDVTLAASVTQAVTPGAATLTASPTDPDNNIQKVEFYVKSTHAELGDLPSSTVTSAPWTYSMSSLATDHYYAYAVVTDTEGNTGVSQRISFSIVTTDSDGDGLPDSWEMLQFGNLDQTGAGDFDGDGITNAWEYAHSTDASSSTNDSEPDGLPDDWEMYYFAGLGETGATDYDGDGLDNAWEFTHGTNPCTLVADSDGDGLPDDWEMYYFGKLDWSGSDDYEFDGLDNLWEYQHGTDPNTSIPDIDTDGDGLADDWEMFYFGNLDEDGAGDFDADFLNNEWEYLHGTNPAAAIVTDSDGDGLADDWEMFYFGDLDETGSTNPDNDGVINIIEFVMGTDPTSAADSDANGLKDDWETYWFGSLGQSATADPDGDGLTNLQEYTKGLNPLDGDTDGDGMGDGYEDYYAFAPLSAANNATTKVGPDDDKDSDGISNKNEALQGRIPISSTEQPSFTVPPPTFHWFGVKGAVYLIRGSTNLSTWTTYPQAYFGDNKKISVPVSDIVGGTPPPFFFAQLLIYYTPTQDGDSDGLPMIFETGVTGTNPDLTDTDGDGIPDSEDISNAPASSTLEVFTPLQ